MQQYQSIIAMFEITMNRFVASNAFDLQFKSVQSTQSIQSNFRSYNSYNNQNQNI